MTSGASPVSPANDIPLVDVEMEVRTSTARAIPSPLPTTITFTLDVYPAPVSIVCTKV